MSWARYLARVAASAAVRRLVYLAIAAIIALVLSFAPGGKAQAATTTCLPDPLSCDQAQAYADTVRQFSQRVAEFCVPGAYIDGEYKVDPPTTSGTARYYWGQYRCRTPSSTWSNWIRTSTERAWFKACAAGSVWDETTHTCAQACADRDPIAGRATRNSLPMCNNGCLYQPAPPETGPVPEVSIILGDYTAASSWRPTGASCETPDVSEPWDKDKSTCYTAPGSTFKECVQPDGRHCVTNANTGNKFCWTNGEEGPKRTADGTEGADRKKAPASNEPPPGMDEPAPTGTNQGGTVINGNQYNTTTYGGGAGKPGQGDTGLPGDNDGDGKVDPGEGEGDDEEQGEASGSGACDGGWSCSGDSIACAQLSELHESKCAVSKGAEPGDLEGNEGEADTGVGKLFGASEEHNVLDVLGNYISFTRACPANPSVSAGDWGTIELPLDKICVHLQLLGTLMLAFAYVAAVGMILK